MKRRGRSFRLNKRIVWRLQALAEGDLSERARRRAAELARDADLVLAVALACWWSEQTPFEAPTTMALRGGARLLERMGQGQTHALRVGRFGLGSDRKGSLL